jgi:hypothetical protein
MLWGLEKSLKATRSGTSKTLPQARRRVQTVGSPSLKQHDVIIFFDLCTKAESKTLTAAQLKFLKTAVAVIKQQFRP